MNIWRTVFFLISFSQLQNLFAQDSIVETSSLWVLNTTSVNLHYKITAHVSIEKSRKDSTEYFLLSFRKRPFASDTFLLVTDASDSSRYMARIEEITAKDTFADRPVYLTIYDTEFGETEINSQPKKYLIRISIKYPKSLFKTPPEIHYIIALPPIRDTRGFHISEEENYRKYYHTDELIIRTVPGVPR